jgi:hypothetical protein
MARLAGVSNWRHARLFALLFYLGVVDLVAFGVFGYQLNLTKSASALILFGFEVLMYHFIQTKFLLAFYLLLSRSSFSHCRACFLSSLPSKLVFLSLSLSI